MSTKTTFKRIALVTVAALGFGVLTSVAPASATGPQEIVSSIAVGTVPTFRMRFREIHSDDGNPEGSS